jgi:ribonuclease Y
MAIIGAAALIAIAVVIAAVLYGRTHKVAVASGSSVERDATTALQAALAERSAGLDRRADSTTKREEALGRREAELDHEREALSESRIEVERTLERVAGMSGAKAKQLLLAEIEEQAKHDSARRIRQIEEETKREAERRVRNILSVCMQRLAAGHAAETTVSVVQLAADDMKGRIIGREGRNIRALENLTGVEGGRPVGL